METQILDLSSTVKSLLDRKSLDFSSAYAVMEQLISGETDPVVTASLLTAMRNRQETPEEIAGFSQAMYDHAKLITYRGSEPLVDIVGTGGARFKTFNVSTTAALVLPSMGVSVAKHGNRSNSSPSGSADLLEALGVNITMDSKTAEYCLNKNGLTFMFAPIYHPAMKHVVPIRKKLRFRTIFNLLGPLTNPADVRRQVTGIFSKKYLLPVARALEKRGHEHAILVHSELGADEVTNTGTTHVVELLGGEISQYKLTAESFGTSACEPKDLMSLSPAKSAVEAVRILMGEASPRADFVAVNAVLALRAAGRSENLSELFSEVTDTLQSGVAVDNLRRLVKDSGGDIDALEAAIELV